MIRLARPWFDRDEQESVQRVLASGMLIQGAEVAAFEAAVARRLHSVAPAHGTVIALAVSSGTVALELALMAAGIGPGDEVIVPAITWPSPGNAVVLRGALPVLVDVDPTTYNIDAKKVADVLTPRTRAVIAIDQFGVPAEIPTIRSIAGDVHIIEDAACAIGSSYAGQPCGLLGDVGTFSFHPRKVITTGEGGMVVTRDRRRADSIRALRNHGQDSPGVFRDAGPNARLSELHAAIGNAQMAKLDRMLTRRREIADEIRAAVRLRWQTAPEDTVVNHQTLGFVLPEPVSGTLLEARNALLAALRADGVESSLLSYGLHRLPQFARFATNVARSFPNADRVADGGVAVPIHPQLESTEVSTIIDLLRRHADWALDGALA